MFTKRSIGLLCVRVAALLFAAPALTLANCEKLTGGPPQQFGIENERFIDCKEHPADAGKAIIATAIYQKGSSFTSPPDDNTGLYGLDLAIVRTSDGRRLKRQVYESAFSSDAIRLVGVRVDTAPYVLARGIRAIGVRSRFRTYSRAAPHEFENLSLYVETASGFKRVLDQLETLDSGGEVGECSGELRDIRRTVALPQSSTKGYFDLRITATQFQTEFKKVKGKCVDIKSAPAVEHTLLKFDGDVYPHQLRGIQ